MGLTLLGESHCVCLTQFTHLQNGCCEDELFNILDTLAGAIEVQSKMLLTVESLKLVINDVGVLSLLCCLLYAMETQNLKQNQKPHQVQKDQERYGRRREQSSLWYFSLLSFFVLKSLPQSIAVPEAPLHGLDSDIYLQ